MKQDSIIINTGSYIVNSLDVDLHISDCNDSITGSTVKIWTNKNNILTTAYTENQYGYMTISNYHLQAKTGDNTLFVQFYTDDTVPVAGELWTYNFKYLKKLNIRFGDYTFPDNIQLKDDSLPIEITTSKIPNVDGSLPLNDVLGVKSIGMSVFFYADDILLFNREYTNMIKKIYKRNDKLFIGDGTRYFNAILGDISVSYLDINSGRMAEVSLTFNCHDPHLYSYKNTVINRTI